MNMKNTLRRWISSNEYDRQRAWKEVQTFDPEKRWAWLEFFWQDTRREVRDFGVQWGLDLLSQSPETWGKPLLQRLKRALEEEDPFVGQSLILILREAALSDSDHAQRQSLFQKALKASEADLRYQALVAAELLEWLDAAYEKQVRALLNDEDQEIRIVAIQALTRLNPPDLISTLKEIYPHSRLEEKIQIVLSLVDRHAPDIWPWLEETLKKAPYPLPILKAMGAYGDLRSIGVLKKWVKGWFRNPFERVEAAYALYRLGDSEGLKWIKKFKKSKNPALKGYAIEKFKAMTRKRRV